MIGLIILIIAVWGASLLFERKLYLARELGRFSKEPQDVYSQLAEQYRLILAGLGSRSEKKQTVSYQAAQAEKEMTKKLREAGLESPVEQGRFVLIRATCSIGCPVIGMMMYLYLPAYYATIFTLMLTAVGLLVPMFWLNSRAGSRLEDIQRELPLVLDLTNLGTSAGWDTAASLERVIDALSKEFPDHPLLKELRRARWLTASGYTWDEALERVAKRLSSDSVRRCTLALSQAMRQGGDRTSQLEGIAEDAQRSYYAALDKRLAKLPVKVLLVTLGLMVAFFLIILSPAAVQVKRIFFP